MLDTACGPLVGRAGPGLAPGMAATLYLRPEALGASGETVFDVTLERVDFEGAFATVHARLADGTALVAAATGAGRDAQPGQAARLGFAPADAIVLADDARGAA